MILIATGSEVEIAVAARQALEAGGTPTRVVSMPCVEWFEAQDEAIVQSVQRGVRSRFYSRGRYSPTRERGVHHFHRLLCEFLA